ncbi:MAG: hypothetical protein PHU23_02440 [Dehalococcoidales bacterium]|nr:hypothetical protein [Dehalococcoidales bacterium]
MKAISPPGVTLGEVFQHSMPFLLMGVGKMVPIMIFPAIALWLPSMMMR